MPGRDTCSAGRCRSWRVPTRTSPKGPAGREPESHDLWGDDGSLVGADHPRVSNVPAPIPARAPVALIVKPAQGVVRRPWLVFLAVGLVAVELYYLVPALADPLYLVIGFAGAAAIVAGWIVNRPAQRGWLLLAAGIGLYSLGDLVYTILAAETGTE